MVPSAPMVSAAGVGTFLVDVIVGLLQRLRLSGGLAHRLR